MDGTMTSRERLVAATLNTVPDRVPAAPDMTFYLPLKRTGKPYWETCLGGTPPLWQVYLEAADHYGMDAWTAPTMSFPCVYAENGRCDVQYDDTFDKDRDAMVRRTTVRTPDGDLTAESICFRAEPPTATVRLMKDLATDFPKYKWLMSTPESVDTSAAEVLREACHRRDYAFGVTVGYPGFQSWMCSIQTGVEALAYAEMDTPAILQEWFELDLERGTRLMELIARDHRVDYILFGGSGTITLASPALARKYAIPAGARWSRMAKEAGIPTMLHSCGKNRVLADMLASDTDVDLLNPLEPPPMGDIDLAEVKRAHGHRLAFMGNLHTTDVMLNGSARDVRRESLKAMLAAGEDGGFILSTGDQCGRETPDANVFALVETAREFGTYPLDTDRIRRAMERVL